MDTPKRGVTVGDLQIGPQEKKYVNEVLDSGRLSYGPFCRRFEAEWADKHDCKFAVFMNSGTSALHVALAALKIRHGWSDGDEVIVPSVTFVATVNVCLHNNLKPVLVDVDPYTFNLDPDKIDAAVTGRTRCVIPVHLTGLPADMGRIMAAANRHRLRVVEDSCETTFARLGNLAVGSWGDIGCFSTYMAHYVVTGVGGLATTNDPELAVLLRSLVNHGRDSIYLNIDDDKNVTRELIARRFRFEHLGHSFRPTEMEAALGLAQIERWPLIVARRKAVAARYTQGLYHLHLEGKLRLPTVSSVYASGDNHVFMIFPLVVSPNHETSCKAELVAHLEERGVETRDLLPLVNQPVYKKLWPGRDLYNEFPVARWLDQRAFYVGCHQFITDEDADHVVNSIRDFFEAKTRGELAA